MNAQKWPLKISPLWTLAALLCVLSMAAILFAMNRPPICTCGSVKLFHFIAQSSENSQHLTDWYTPSHIIHGFIFYGIGYLARRRFSALSLGAVVCLSVLVEGAWEIVENSPIIIDRYREVTVSFGYSGDSIVNSVADIAWMLFGFLVASRLPWKATLGLALLFEVFVGYMIRDNLALNVMMLTVPLESVKEWQAGANGYWVTGDKAKDVPSYIP
jgi:hypothetical protein